MSPATPSNPADPGAAAQLDAVWGDPATWTEHGLHWTHLPAVKARIAEMVSGDAGIHPLEWFFRQVAAERPLPLRRILVLACGAGYVEREAVSRGWAASAVAIDFSSQVLARARAQAQAEGLAIEYHHADMNRLPLGQAPFLPGTFDAVLGVAGVHHGSDLERLYADVAALLVPGGWFFLDEYVGPDRFQWPQAQERHLNTLLDLLPPRLRMTTDGRLKGNARRPSVQEVIAVDASEAVRSSELLPLLPGHFEVQAVRPYGGSMLHLVLGSIAQNFAPAAEAPYLTALMEAEDELIRAGQIGHDFACVIARPRPAAASAAPPPDR
ncbi:class I SAM-dependent methyltransferase [Hydrogenophaga sp. UC242_53]|jgi:SAM-dependent methyltransferase|uniref:class I SAM-dependent methyltransferase n=1 Tax=Hydrogenophaga sp. UC242_53 TaxID=3350170 RepID=UPI0036D26F8C